MGKKEYNSKTVGTVWMNEKKNGDLFTTVDLVAPFNDNGKPNKYCKGKLFFEDATSGKVYEIHQFKTFDNDKHENILADLCVELNDEEYSTEVSED